MLGFFRKKPEPQAEPDLSAGNDGPLAGVSVRDGKYFFESQNDNVNVSQGADGIGGKVLEAYGPDRFHSHLVKSLCWVGKKKDLQSLQIASSNHDFKAACDVAYNRLADSWAGPLLDKLGDDAITDIVVMSIGFGPVIKNVTAEMAKKKRTVGAAKSAANVDTAGGEVHEQN